jgi:hypothetical protein
MILPTGEHVLSAMKKLPAPGAPAEAWDTLLDRRAPVRLLYGLQIAEALLQGSHFDDVCPSPLCPLVSFSASHRGVRQAAEPEQWRAEFRRRGGVVHLYRCLRAGGFTAADGVAGPRIKCLAMLQRIFAALTICALRLARCWYLRFCLTMKGQRVMLCWTRHRCWQRAG